MATLTGYVMKSHGAFMQVRLLNGSVSWVITRRKHRPGEKLILIYDEIRDLITEAYTISEWEALSNDLDLEEVGPHEEQIETQIPDCYDLEI